MRAAVACVAAGAALVGLFALVGPQRPEDAASTVQAAEPAVPEPARYGPAVGDDGLVEDPQLPEPTGTDSAEPAPEGSQAPDPAPASSTSTSTSTPVDGHDSGGDGHDHGGDDGSGLSDATTLIDDDVEIVHDHGDHSEEEPVDEFPDLEPGQYPVTSNLADGVEYPLHDMVELAVELLDAEVTGAHRDDYPHLAEVVSVCCEGLVVDGAVVLFGATQADPATIIVDWHADAAGAEERLVRGSTRSRWFWRDGTWMGEYEAHLEE